ncbi:WG repeat-containing protein [Pseudoneobacillus sp. C159]
MFFEDLRRALPEGARLLWDDWQMQPAVSLNNVNQDGKKEMLITYRLRDEIYTTIFIHDETNWYASTTTKGTLPFRVRGINLFPAVVKGVGGNRWGYINHKGKFVTPLKYEDAGDFQINGLAVVKIRGKYGLINQYGQFIVHPKYDSINPFFEGRATVIDDKGFKVINERGRVLTKKAYSFIGNYQNGRALFSGTNEENQYLYGYLTKQGKEVVPLRYQSATNFSNGKAVVKKQDGYYQLINLSGKTLNTYDQAFVGELSEGLMTFQQENGGKFGFMNEQGETIIEPAFTGAQAFRNGRAIVNTDRQYGFQYGLIDRTGKLTIQPIYNDIKMLGENRVALGKAVEETAPFKGSKYAIADIDGNILTDFKFFNVQAYQNGYASATDGIHTFFLDKSGHVAKGLPIVKGNGTLTFEGELIKANIDMRLKYNNLKGLLVWSQNQVIRIDHRFRVVERKFNPNKDYLVYYPEVHGMRFPAAQKKVNQRLAELSAVKEMNPSKPLDSSYTGDFEVPFFRKRLIIFELNGYHYPFGAAHGMPSKIYAHVDLESGAFYALKDLFKQGSPYVKVLSDIIGEQIKTDPQYSYVFRDSYKGIAPHQPFYVDDNNLYIYFTPYEIAPYAAGFPTFKIPYNEIDTIINKEGPFWRAFH